MAAPDGVLWEYEEHTHAKHRLLVGYLHAWLPIMAQRNRRLNLIDGFAGPGRYTGGEPGSPLLMLDAYLNHKGRAGMGALDVYFDFIELDHDRVAHLREELAGVEVPANVHIEVIEGSFDKVMGEMLDGIPRGQGLVPTFAFLDPFGYTGYGLRLSSRILEIQEVRGADLRPPALHCSVYRRPCHRTGAQQPLRR